ncbi:MAG TPA: inositol monophosphatase family protein [Acidimicrobiales bacterium]|nr:inositol monophosphatase family protein [Acidimicrobiales bacterium]
MTPAPAPVPASELLELALKAATAAGTLLREGQGSAPADVSTKTSLTDMVSELDRASEALIAEMILGARPGDAILGEEGGLTGAGTSGVRWVVDPLDGTTNYLYGYPVWAVSIAAEVDGAVVAGVVRDPNHDDTFSAVRDHGSWCNGRRLGVGGAESLATALVATGFGYEADVRSRQGREVAHLLPRVRDIRRGGAAALDLCWVADGRVDAYYERGLQPWDWAAGMLVASEAGATVSVLPDGTAVVAPPQLHQPLVDLLADPSG